ncbi:MAG: enoyl-CoA hydratase-related protein [Pseudomonadota bacterium]
MTRHEATDSMDYSRYTQLRVAKAAGIATLTIDSGEKMNPVNAELHHELGTVFQQLAVDNEVKVIIFTGANGAFCAGANLNWVRAQHANPPPVHEARSSARAIVLGILDCPKPIIARVNGDAIGLGASLALLSDIIIADENARIADPHVRIGLVAGDGGSLIWPLLIGYARAKEFLLTGNTVSAPDAARMGLINYAVPTAELDEKVNKFARQLAEGASLAIQFTKTSTNIPLKQAVESVLESSLALEVLTFRSADVGEGVSAFLERRKPVFQGR